MNNPLKPIALVLLVLGGVSVCVGCERGGPGLVSIDMGRVRFNQSLPVKFEIENRTGQLQHLAKVLTSCTCASPDFSPVNLKPGEKLTLTIRVRPNKLGIYDQKAVVKDSGGIILYILRILGKVQTGPGLLPKSLSIEDPIAGSTPGFKINMIVPADLLPVRVTVPHDGVFVRGHEQSDWVTRKGWAKSELLIHVKPGEHRLRHEVVREVPVQITSMASGADPGTEDVYDLSVRCTITPLEWLRVWPMVLRGPVNVMNQKGLVVRAFTKAQDQTGASNGYWADLPGEPILLENRESDGMGFVGEFRLVRQLERGVAYKFIVKLGELMRTVDIQGY